MPSRPRSHRARNAPVRRRSKAPAALGYGTRIGDLVIFDVMSRDAAGVIYRARREDESHVLIVERFPRGGAATDPTDRAGDLALLAELEADLHIVVDDTDYLVFPIDSVTSPPLVMFADLPDCPEPERISTRVRLPMGAVGMLAGIAGTGALVYGMASGVLPVPPPVVEAAGLLVGGLESGVEVGDDVVAGAGRGLVWFTTGSTGPVDDLMSGGEGRAEMAEIAGTIAQVKAVWAKPGTFSGGDMAPGLFAAGVLPSTVVRDGTVVRNRWGGGVSVVGADGATFALVYTGVPKGACAAMVGASGPRLFAAVNGHRALPLDPAEVAAICSDPLENHVTWQVN